MHFPSKKLFSDLCFVLEPGSRTAVLGPNGSGKSSLLKILAGALRPRSGQLEFWSGNGSISAADAVHLTSFAAPYAELIEELNVREHFDFQKGFRPFLDEMSFEGFAEVLGLRFDPLQSVSSFSSGMKQRLKLALAVLGRSELILLDEPCSNLDAAGRVWYQSLLERFSIGRTLLVGSNHVPDEISLCTTSIEWAVSD